MRAQELTGDNNGNNNNNNYNGYFEQGTMLDTFFLQQLLETNAIILMLKK